MESPYSDELSLVQLKKMQIAVDKPKTEEGVFLDFVSKAIDASLAKPEKYEAELEKPSQHLFLTAYRARS